MSKKENLTALVTGAHGHTGTFLVKALIDRGYKITATDLKTLDRQKIMTKETLYRNDLTQENIDHPNVTFIAADLTDKESLKALWDGGKQYDVIFHPASLYDYFAELYILMKINVDGTRNLLEVICEKQPNNLPRFIHWSTCGVFGSSDYEVRKDENGKKYRVPADETAPFNPPNHYCTSKMFQEFVVYEFYQDKKVPMTILRSQPIAGKAQLYGAFNLFYMIYKFGNMIVPVVWPNEKKNHMPAVHVEDLADAAIFCFEHDETIGEAYIVGCDNCTQTEFMDYLCSITDCTTVIIPVHYKFYNLGAKLAEWWFGKQILKARKWKMRPMIDGPMMDYISHEYYFSNEKLKKLGFKYKYPTVIDTVRDSVRWYIDNGWFE